MSLVKYIRELEHQDAQEVNEIAFDDGTDKAKKTTMNKLPVSFKNLIDTPPDMATEAGKHVEVNPQGTGLVYVPAPASAYTEKCSNNTDIIVSTGTTLGGWKDICTLTLAKDIDIHKARFFYSLRCREVGNQTGTLRVGIKLNGFSPTTFQEFHITDDMNAVISNFLINDSAYSAGDTVTLSVAGVGDHVGFDLSIKGTVEPSYFEVTVQQVAGVGASIASTTITDTTNFNGILSSADDNVQKALDTIDDSKNEDGWKQVSLPATFGSTTDGVDTINFVADVSDIFEKSMPVRVVSDSGDLTFYCSDVTTNTIKLNGEVSVSGTITAIYFSREYKPKGFKVGVDEYKAYIFRDTDQAWGNSTAAAMAMAGMKYDINSNHSGQGVIAAITGYYDIKSDFNISTEAPISQAFIYVGGVRIINSSASRGYGSNFMSTLYVKRGDVMKGGGFQNSGATSHLKPIDGKNNFLMTSFTGV